MPTNYPTSIDAFTNPATTDYEDTIPHATQHQNHNDSVTAVETKVGTGASTPVANTVLRGTGTGTSSWTQVSLGTDVSGTLLVQSGGTGATTLTGILKGNGQSAVTAVTAPTGAIVGTTDSQTLTNKAISTGSSMAESLLTTTDITTNNVSTTKHGFAPKAPNDATKYLDGTGAYSTPAAGTAYGSLGSTAITSNFTTTTTPAFVDVTSLAVTVTVPAGRTVRVTVDIAQINCTASGTKGLNVGLFEGATQLSLATFTVDTNQSGYDRPAHASAILTPSTGSHTYKVAVSQTSAGTITLAAGATQPAYILAELL